MVNDEKLMPVEMSVFAPQEGKLLFQIKETGISPAKGRKSIFLQHHRKTVDMVFFPVTSVLLYNVISAEGAMLEHLSIAMDATRRWRCQPAITQLPCRNVCSPKCGDSHPERLRSELRKGPQILAVPEDEFVEPSGSELCFYV